MTAPTFEVPAFVQARVQRRADSDRRIGHGQCIYGCRAHARPYVGGTFCDEHSPWQQTGQPRPGAAAHPEHLQQRREAGQYRTASMPTISDARAEASGKRDPNRAGRREHDAITDRFLTFHEQNPNVYARVVELVTDAVLRGHKRIGVGALFEQLRYSERTETNGDRYRLNNDFRAPLVRLLIDEHPEWADLFELRERKTA